MIQPSTRRSCNSARKSYEFFCRNHGYISFPASLKAVTHWLTEVMRTAKPATANSYLNALRSFHLESGIPTSVFEDPRIDLVIRGGNRVFGEGTKRLRFPLTSSILLRVINEIGNDEEGINVRSLHSEECCCHCCRKQYTVDVYINEIHQFDHIRKLLHLNSQLLASS